MQAKDNGENPVFRDRLILYTLNKLLRLGIVIFLILSQVTTLTITS